MGRIFFPRSATAIAAHLPHTFPPATSDDLEIYSPFGYHWVAYSFYFRYRCMLAKRLCIFERSKNKDHTPGGMPHVSYLPYLFTWVTYLPARLDKKSHAAGRMTVNPGRQRTVSCARSSTNAPPFWYFVTSV